MEYEYVRVCLRRVCACVRRVRVRSVCVCDLVSQCILLIFVGHVFASWVSRPHHHDNAIFDYWHHSLHSRIIARITIMMPSSIIGIIPFIHALLPASP